MTLHTSRGRVLTVPETAVEDKETVHHLAALVASDEN